MRHRPPGPPASARLGVVAARLLRPSAAARIRRLGVLLAVTAAVTAVLLAAPVVTTPEWPSVAVDSSSSQTTTTGSPIESSTAWPVQGTSSAAGAPAPVAAEQPVEATTEPDAPAPPEQVTTAPSPAAATPAGASPSTAAEEPSVPAPAPTTTAAASAAATPADFGADLGAEGQVLELVNQQRAAAGCAPLTGDDGLAAVARAHSADMRDQDYFAHVNLAGADPFARAEEAGVIARAENIAMGQRDAAAVVDSWMNSPPHRANILDCGLQRLGVGMATGAGGPWWTQLFG